MHKISIKLWLCLLASTFFMGCSSGNQKLASQLIKEDWITYDGENYILIDFQKNHKTTWSFLADNGVHDLTRFSNGNGTWKIIGDSLVVTFPEERFAALIDNTHPPKIRLKGGFRRKVNYILLTLSKKTHKISREDIEGKVFRIEAKRQNTYTDSLEMYFVDSVNAFQTVYDDDPRFKRLEEPMFGSFKHSRLINNKFISDQRWCLLSHNNHHFLFIDKGHFPSMLLRVLDINEQRYTFEAMGADLIDSVDRGSPKNIFLDKGYMYPRRALSKSDFAARKKAIAGRWKRLGKDSTFLPIEMIQENIKFDESIPDGTPFFKSEVMGIYQNGSFELYKHYTKRKGSWTLSPEGDYVIFRYTFYDKYRSRKKYKKRMLLGVIFPDNEIEIYPGFFRDLKRRPYVFEKVADN